MLVKDLGGYSGCKILLFQDEKDGYFVRKISASDEYNKRLEAQCLKQVSFRNSFIKTPSVFRKGYDENGLFYFDMEYIQGVTLSKYISKVDVSEISGLADLIMSNFIITSNKANDVQVFKNKVSELKGKVKKLNNQIVNKAIDYLGNYNWKNFSNNYSHGDLTLENILVCNNGLYYIDFLDSFYDSWLLDVGKLLQDVECLWSYRNNDSLVTNTKLRIAILKEVILRRLKSIDSKYVKDAYAALLLNLLRIFPYVKDDKTYCYLEEQTKRIMDKIKDL